MATNINNINQATQAQQPAYINNNMYSNNKWWPDKIDYFNLDLYNQDYIDTSLIISVGTVIYFRNIFTFIDRLYDIVATKGEDQV